MRLRWFWVLLPVVLGTILAFILLLTDFENSLIYVQADLGSIIFGLGVMASIVIAVVIIVLEQIEKVQINATIEFAEDRRRFLRRLDHELKNPLTAILAGLANLSILDDPDERAVTLKSVSTQVDRMRKLVADLRKLSELETRPLDLSPVKMTVLLEETFALIEDEPDAMERLLTLSIPRAPWPLPTISGDYDLLVLAVHNLLMNAIKFTQPNDTIEMRAFEDGSRVVIEVADTGPGIPESEIPHVWQELYRGAGARGVQGSGLGLALVRAIVSRHEGEITLRSRPGEGTVFTMRLPVRIYTEPHITG
jgi:two-component system OmpR family sensor kinase